MDAYTPTSTSFLYGIAAVFAGILVIGFAVTRIKVLSLARSAAWLLFLAGFLLSLLLSHSQPPGVRMLAICGALLFSMKAVVLVETRFTEGLLLRILPWLGFSTLWFGMNPRIFSSLGSKPLSGALPLMAKGSVRVLIGIFFLFLARTMMARGLSPYLASLAALPGLSLILHFGIFNILAGLWRLCGVPCESLFQAPLLSTSLSEFWGRRWNLAFSEMTRIAVYSPLSPRWGKNPAAWAAFMFSGLLHEFAISLPVRAGYGLPFSYFVMHGFLLQVERILSKKGYAIDRRPWVGRLWTLFWIVLPLPLLFHPPFLKGVIWPILGLGSGHE